MVEVVAAMIWDKEFMICQRPAYKARGLLWEFVGGNVEAGETKRQALVRECREELNIAVSVGDVFTEVTHEYPDITIHLTLFNCSVTEGTPELLEHNDLKWITPEEIPLYAFCPADTAVLKLLAGKPSLLSDPGFTATIKAANTRPSAWQSIPRRWSRWSYTARCTESEVSGCARLPCGRKTCKRRTEKSKDSLLYLKKAMKRRENDA